MRKTLPFELAIAKPCQQPWQEMSGNASKRHCSSCRSNVHNLAAMTRREIVKTIEGSNGCLCARVTRRLDGSIVMADPDFIDRGGVASKVAGVLVGAMLSAGTVAAQSKTEQSGRATVSGMVHNPDDKKLTAAPEVLFIQDGRLIEQVSANADGSWRADVTPGRYDIVFRTGPFYGARVKAVELHAGDQAFAPLKERFDFGHLGMQDNEAGTYQEMGAVAMVIKHPALYNLRHPLRYMKNLRHNFG